MEVWLTTGGSTARLDRQPFQRLLLPLSFSLQVTAGGGAGGEQAPVSTLSGPLVGLEPHPR